MQLKLYLNFLHFYIKIYSKIKTTMTSLNWDTVFIEKGRCSMNQDG